MRCRVWHTRIERKLLHENCFLIGKFSVLKGLSALRLKCFNFFLFFPPQKFLLFCNFKKSFHVHEFVASVLILTWHWVMQLSFLPFFPVFNFILFLCVVCAYMSNIEGKYWRRQSRQEERRGKTRWREIYGTSQHLAVASYAFSFSFHRPYFDLGIKGTSIYSIQLKKQHFACGREKEAIQVDKNENQKTIFSLNPFGKVINLN